MNNQKDNKKTGLKSYGHDKSFRDIIIPTQASFETVSKKTEKLITALYMVTDCMDSDDALRSKLRLLGVDLFSIVYKIKASNPQEKEILIDTSIDISREIISFANIASNIGFISDMNMSILNREFLLLIDELSSHKDQSSQFAFSLNAEFFAPDTDKDITKVKINHKGQIKDKSNKQLNQYLKTDYYGHLNRVLDPNEVKRDRYNRILDLIKDKREVSIKDISLAFTDCSEKTIQRTLSSLISDSKIQKIGSKRWSRYAYLQGTL